jgi:hypothetical protein
MIEDQDSFKVEMKECKAEMNEDLDSFKVEMKECKAEMNEDLDSFKVENEREPGFLQGRNERVQDRIDRV